MWARTALDGGLGTMGRAWRLGGLSGAGIEPTTGEARACAGQVRFIRPRSASLVFRFSLFLRFLPDSNHLRAPDPLIRFYLGLSGPSAAAG